MPFQLDEFIRLRPFLYHVTCRENLQALRTHRRIHTALSLPQAANRLDLADVRRESYVSLDTSFGSSESYNASRRLQFPITRGGVAGIIW